MLDSPSPSPMQLFKTSTSAVVRSVPCGTGLSRSGTRRACELIFVQSTSAPTGSGKTVCLELAIVRMLVEQIEGEINGGMAAQINACNQSSRRKAVYLAPMKALCRGWDPELSSSRANPKSIRVTDPYTCRAVQRLECPVPSSGNTRKHATNTTSHCPIVVPDPLSIRSLLFKGLKCLELTGDSDQQDVYRLADADIVITTPEKWDSLTRGWRSSPSLVGDIALVLIDEVHFLNEKGRGPTLEAVVSRMKVGMVWSAVVCYTGLHC